MNIIKTTEVSINKRSYHIIKTKTSLGIAPLKQISVILEELRENAKPNDAIYFDSKKPCTYQAIQKVFYAFFEFDSKITVPRL
ncbi:hypothetical protein BU103_13065 [Staphylococcus xylosus]|nr:hypothetical protein BU103_13065 [Staphylococcus xylosus]